MTVVALAVARWEAEVRALAEWERQAAEAKVRAATVVGAAASLEDSTAWETVEAAPGAAAAAREGPVDLEMEAVAETVQETASKAAASSGLIGLAR